MPTLRSSSVPREVSLRKELLNKIFLQTLSHDDPVDDHCTPEPSSQAACLLIPPCPIREQPGISEIAEQDIEMKNKEVLLENSISIFSGPTEMQMVSQDDKNCLKSRMKSNDSQYNAFASASNSASLQECTSSMNNIDSATEAASSEASETPVLAMQKISRSSKRMSKKYSKILARIETLERSVAIFCEKENETPSDAAVFKNPNSISIFQNIKSSQQKKKYEKYFKKTLKVCNRLESEISLYSQYVETLETAVSSMPKGSKLSKMLEAKLKSAYKFHEENLSHEELKTLIRQLKLVNLLIKKFESENKHRQNFPPVGRYSFLLLYRKISGQYF